MKTSRILPAAGLLTLLACGAALAQSPSQIPIGAGVGVDRPPAGSRAGANAKRAPAAGQPAVDANRSAVSQTCTQQANAQGLHGKARKSFREKCKRSGGR